MSNPTTDQDVRNGIIEEALVFAPDALEAMDRYADIEGALEKDLANFDAAMGAARLSLHSLRAHLALLHSETGGNRDEIARRLKETKRLAARSDVYGFLALPTLRLVAGELEDDPA